MKFAVCTNKPAAVVKPQVAPVTPQDITEAYEGMMAAYMELSDAQRNLDEVCQVMDNINLTMQMLKVGGAEAIKIVNVDKSLETLCAVAEEKLTVQAAQEGLGNVLKTLVEKIKEYIKKISAWIREHWDNFVEDSRYRDIYKDVMSLKKVRQNMKFVIPNEEVTVLSYSDMKLAIDNCAEIANYGQKLRNLVNHSPNLTKDIDKLQELQFDENVAVRYELKTGKANDLGWNDVSQLVDLLGDNERAGELKTGMNTWVEMLGFAKEDQEAVINAITATDADEATKTKVIQAVGKAYSSITRLITLRHTTLGQVLRTASILLKKARKEADRELQSAARKILLQGTTS